MKNIVIVSFIFFLINSSFSQTIGQFAGTWSEDLSDNFNHTFRINYDKNSGQYNSDYNVWDNQLSYNLTNKLKGDTLFFYFQGYDAGIGGGAEIKAGNIIIPKVGKLIGKAVIQSDKLNFTFKAKKMEIKSSYLKAEE